MDEHKIRSVSRRFATERKRGIKDIVIHDDEETPAHYLVTEEGGVKKIMDDVYCFHNLGESGIHIKVAKGRGEITGRQYGVLMSLVMDKVAEHPIERIVGYGMRIKKAGGKYTPIPRSFRWDTIKKELQDQDYSFIFEAEEIRGIETRGM